MRPTVQEFQKSCNDLVESAYENNGGDFTSEERQMIGACIRTIQTIVAPDQDLPPPGSPLGVVPPVIE